MTRPNSFVSFPVLIGLLLIVSVTVRADAQADWKPVATALNVADQAYSAEIAKCSKAEPECMPHNSPIHEARLESYEAAKTSLVAYINKWDGDPDWENNPPSTPAALKLVVRLAFVSQRSETLTDATKYYKLCLQSPLIDNGFTTSITGDAQPIRAVCSEGTKEMCLDVFQTCDASPADRGPGNGILIGAVPAPGPSWTVGGTTSDIASKHLAHGNQRAPAILSHLTIGQVVQIQRQVQSVLPGGY